MAIAEMPRNSTATYDSAETQIVPAQPCTILSALQGLASGGMLVPISSTRSDALPPVVEHSYPYNVLLRDKLIAIESRGDASYFRVTDAGRGMIAAVRSLTP
jgi:hypothetical protein